MKLVLFDIETLALEGQPHTAFTGEGGLACCVTMTHEYSAVREKLGLAFPPHLLQLWDAHTIEPLVEHLMSADVLVSWNGIGFDLPILSYLVNRPLFHPNHLDLQRLLREQTRKRIKLNEAALATLGVGKLGTGADAPGLGAAGRWAELFTYCISDVDLLRRLYLYVAVHGMIKTSIGDFPLDIGGFCGQEEETSGTA